MTNDSENNDQVALSEWASTSNNAREQSDEAERTTNQSASDSESPQRPDSSGTPFSFSRNNIPATGETDLEEKAITAILNDGPAPPLPETVSHFSQLDPVPREASMRAARALYLYAFAGIGALPGYSLDDSMLPLRDCIQAALNISTTNLVDHDFLQEKRPNGRQKYYSLTTAGRRFLRQSDHPDIGFLLSDNDLPVLQDGPVHNFGLLSTGKWLETVADFTHVETPHMRSKTAIDIAGYQDDQLEYVGEVVATEDIESDSLLEKIRFIERSEATSLLVFEKSDVAVAAFEQLEVEDEITVSKEYRNYSIEQFRTELLPSIDHGGIDCIKSITNLNGEVWR